MGRRQGPDETGAGRKPGLVRRRWFQLLFTAMVAYVLGVGTAGESTPAEAEPRVAAVSAADTAELDAAHAENSALTQRLEQAEADAEREVREALEGAASQQQAAVEQAKATVRTRAETRQQEAVAAAVAETEARMASSAASGDENGAAATDPRFSYCYEANDAGYGDYESGVDPEYDWYDDNDGDGYVCEF